MSFDSYSNWYFLSIFFRPYMNWKIDLYKKLIFFTQRIIFIMISGCNCNHKKGDFLWILRKGVASCLYVRWVIELCFLSSEMLCNRRDMREMCLPSKSWYFQFGWLILAAEPVDSRLLSLLKIRIMHFYFLRSQKTMNKRQWLYETQLNFLFSMSL